MKYDPNLREEELKNKVAADYFSDLDTTMKASPSNPNDKREVDWFNIKKELESVGTVENVDILDINHVEFIVNGVKLSFMQTQTSPPVKEEIPFLNNIRLADIKHWSLENGGHVKTEQVPGLLRYLYYHEKWNRYQ